MKRVEKFLRNKVAKKIRIFDNGGKTFDRYTVVIGNKVYGMSANPLSPQGVNQFIGYLDEIDLSDGKEIDISMVPDEVRRAIELRKTAGFISKRGIEESWEFKISDLKGYKKNRIMIGENKEETEKDDEDLPDLFNIGDPVRIEGNPASPYYGMVGIVERIKDDGWVGINLKDKNKYIERPAEDLTPATEDLYVSGKGKLGE